MMNTMIPEGVFIFPEQNSRKGPLATYNMSATYKNLPEGVYTDDIHPNTHLVGYTIFTDDMATLSHCHNSNQQYK